MVTYIDTYNSNGWSYQDYIAECSENAVTPGTEDSPEFYEWMQQRVAWDWEDFEMNIKNSRVCSGPVTVTGSLGLWWGRPEIEPRRFDSLLAAIYACLENCFEYSIKLEKGVLEVAGTHHDGTNHFSIRRASGRFWSKYLF